jgi:hypothetical protein
MIDWSSAAQGSPSDSHPYYADIAPVAPHGMESLPDLPFQPETTE